MKIHNLSALPVIDYRQVSPLQGNLKDLSTANHDKLLNVLTKRGFTTPLFVWRNPADEKPYLLDGHQRHRVMVKNNLSDEGSYEVPYVLIPAASLQEAKEQLLEITSQYGHMTMEGLDEFAFDLELAELDINFDAIDLDKFLDQQVDEVNEADDEAPAVDDINPPVSKLGEVYQLGVHRLMCGDSTDFGAVSELMNGQVADVVFTDPPYGVSYQSNMRTQSEKFAVIKNDDKLISEWIEPVSAVSTGFVFIWTTWKVLGEWIELTKPFGQMTNMIVWDKGGGGIGDLQGTFSTDYEIALVFNRGAKLTGERLGSVWGIGKDASSSYVHPTQKPVALGMQAIRTTTHQGAKVLDVFGGSGSTLIAAIKTNRICYMMELDPKYCDVIRKRYAKHVGEEDWVAATPVVQGAEV